MGPQFAHASNLINLFAFRARSYVYTDRARPQQLRREIWRNCLVFSPPRIPISLSLSLSPSRYYIYTHTGPGVSIRLPYTYIYTHGVYVFSFPFFCAAACRHAAFLSNYSTTRHWLVSICPLVVVFLRLRSPVIRAGKTRELREMMGFPRVLSNIRDRAALCLRLYFI